MATNIETMWVNDPEHLQRTVQNLMSRGGVVQAQSDTEITLLIKKKINVVVLVVGLVLCLVPGLAYLAWYLTADQDQLTTVKVGSPDSIKTDHQHWYDEDSAPATEPAGSTSPAPAPPADPVGLTATDPLTAIAPMATPAPQPTAVNPPPVAPPEPPYPPSSPSGGSSF